MLQESGQAADVLVIGAGMAGLTAATALQRAGCRVLELDGDAFAGPRVEGAALPGWAAAEAVRAGAGC